MSPAAGAGAPGFAVASVVWLQRRTGLGFQLWDCGLFTVARYAQRYWFVGVLNTWLPVPLDWLASLATHARSLWRARPPRLGPPCVFRSCRLPGLPAHSLRGGAGASPCERRRPTRLCLGRSELESCYICLRRGSARGAHAGRAF